MSDNQRPQSLSEAEANLRRGLTSAGVILVALYGVLLLLWWFAP